MRKTRKIRKLYTGIGEAADYGDVDSTIRRLEMLNEAVAGDSRATSRIARQVRGWRSSGHLGMAAATSAIGSTYLSYYREVQGYTDAWGTPISSQHGLGAPVGGRSDTLSQPVYKPRFRGNDAVVAVGYDRAIYGVVFPYPPNEFGRFGRAITAEESSVAVRGVGLARVLGSNRLKDFTRTREGRTRLHTAAGFEPPEFESMGLAGSPGDGGAAKGLYIAVSGVQYNPNFQDTRISPNTNPNQAAANLAVDNYTHAVGIPTI